MTGAPRFIGGSHAPALLARSASDFAISDTGALISVTPATFTLRTLEWIDRRGTHEMLPIEPDLRLRESVS